MMKYLKVSCRGGRSGGHHLPAGALGSGESELTHLVRNSVAPATWPAYSKAWDVWLVYPGERLIAASQEEGLELC